MKIHKPGSYGFLGFCFVIASVVALCISILFVSATVAYAIGKSVNASPAAAAQTSPNTSATSGASATTDAPPADTPPTTGNVQAFHGMLTDSYCAARHARNSNRSSTECTRVCVRRGASYLLVSSNVLYTVQGNKVQLNSFAGQRVTVIGELHGNSIGMHSISTED